MPDALPWRPFFEMTSTTRGKCRECGQEMDIRAGRAQRHLKLHTDLVPPTTVESTTPEDAPPVEQEKPLARGSREWAIQKTLDQIDSGTATPDTVIKGLALLKDYQQFGSSRLDDEKEAASHNEQWDRVISRAKELADAEARLLKHPAVRRRILDAIAALEGSK